MTQTHKYLKAIPVFIVGAIMIGIIIWGISSDKKCERLLSKKDCVEEMVYCKYSHKGLKGSGIEITTSFISSMDTSLHFRTQAFIKVVPSGLPIIVRYSPECHNCFVFLWDSVVFYNGYKIKYEGINYEITKN